jgi:hypothetical protein
MMLGKMAIAFCASVICFVPVGSAVYLFVSQRDQAQFLSRVGLGGLIVGAFAVVEIASRVRRGGFRIGSGVRPVAVFWVAVCTSLGQAFGWMHQPVPPLCAFAGGCAGALVASLVWSREPQTD